VFELIEVMFRILLFSFFLDTVYICNVRVICFLRLFFFASDTVVIVSIMHCTNTIIGGVGDSSSGSGSRVE